MKKISAILILLLLLINVGQVFANSGEQWELIGDSKTVYIDTNSIKTFMDRSNEYTKAKIKLVFNDGYTIDYYIVNRDNLAFSVYIMEDYDISGNLKSRLEFTKSFNQDGTNHIIVKEIIKRAN